MGDVNAVVLSLHGLLCLLQAMYQQVQNEQSPVGLELSPRAEESAVWLSLGEMCSYSKATKRETRHARDCPILPVWVSTPTREDRL